MPARILSLLLFMVALIRPALAQELSKLELLDGRVQMLMPDSFAVMSEELLRLKYPNENRPTIVYTNSDGTINIAVNHPDSEIPNDAVGALRDQIVTSFKNLYPSAVWYRDEMASVDGRNYFVIELTTPAVDTEIRNIMYFSSLNDRLLGISFNCTVEHEQEWAEIGKRVIDSISIVQ